jgi:hypothetical protein
MSWLHNLRALVLPMLEPPKEEPAQPFSDTQTVLARLQNLSDAVLTEKMTHAVSKYHEEGKRLSTVESKAGTMTGFNGIIIALITNLIPWFLGTDKSGTILGAGGAVIIGASVLYFITAMWFSIQALERGSYHVVSGEDIVTQDKQSLIALYISKTMLNYPVINAKVDRMALAQAYLKRGIVALAGLTVWLIGNYLYNTQTFYVPWFC